MATVRRARKPPLRGRLELEVEYRGKEWPREWELEEALTLLMQHGVVKKAALTRLQGPSTTNLLLGGG